MSRVAEVRQTASLVSVSVDGLCLKRSDQSDIFCRQHNKSGDFLKKSPLSINCVRLDELR